MVTVIVVSFIALAGAGYIIYRNVVPGGGADKKLLSKEEKALVQDRSGKTLPRKFKPQRMVLKKTINMRSLQSPNSPASLIDQFSAMDEVGRIRFIATLYSFEPSLLSLALDDKSKDVRITAVRFMAFVPETQVDISPFLTKALDDESSEVREEARDVMDSINDEKTMLKIMGTSLNSKYADTRLKCVSVFISLGVPKEDLKNLMLKALGDDDSKVRDAALEAASSLWCKSFVSIQDAIEYIGKK